MVADASLATGALTCFHAVLDAHLAATPYLVDARFSVTDIVVGWTINWGRRMGQLEGLDHLDTYLRRLFERELCTLNPE